MSKPLEDIALEKDMTELQNRVKREIGLPHYLDVINYSFDFCIEEAEMLGIALDSEDFNVMCRNRRMHTLNRIICLYQTASEIPVKINVGLYDNDTLKKFVKKMYGGNE